MRLLPDTPIVLWELEGSRAVQRAARDAIEHASELFFSVVSFAEVGVKAAIGKLTVPPDFHDRVLQRVFKSSASLPITGSRWRTGLCTLAIRSVSPSTRVDAEAGLRAAVAIGALLLRVDSGRGAGAGTDAPLSSRAGVGCAWAETPASVEQERRCA